MSPAWTVFAVDEPLGFPQCTLHMDFDLCFSAAPLVSRSIVVALCKTVYYVMKKPSAVSVHPVLEPGGASQVVYFFFERTWNHSGNF